LIFSSVAASDVAIATSAPVGCRFWHYFAGEVCFHAALFMANKEQSVVVVVFRRPSDTSRAVSLLRLS